MVDYHQPDIPSLDDRRLAQPEEEGWPMKPDVDGFGIDIVQTDGVAVVCVVGELDLATAPQLREQFIDLFNRGIRTVTVNLARLEFIDSTGLGVLVSALKRFREHGGDLALQSPPPAALQVLEITGLTKVFAIS